MSLLANFSDQTYVWYPGQHDVDGDDRGDGGEDDGDGDDDVSPIH